MGHGGPVNHIIGCTGPFQQPFDTVDHEILLSILSSKYGVKSNALKWFNQYLRPRSFKVTVNSVYSKDRDLMVSVPQGSCVGANMFNLYCSPLQDVGT